MIAADPAPRRQTWPADRFYWSVLEAPGWNRAGPLPIALRQPFEEEVPAASSSCIHAVCVPLGDGRVLACGIAAEELVAVDPGVVALTPRSLPEWVDAHAEAGALNLLVGDFEPRPIRRARLRRHAGFMAALLICSSLVCVGLNRRAAHWETVSEQARIESDRALAEANLPRSDLSRTQELARLRSASDAAARAAPAPDAGVALAALLRTWPTEIPFRTQSLTVSGSAVSTSLSVDGDPGPLLKALRPPQGWKMDEPRLSAGDKLTRLTLQFRASSGDGPR